MEVSSWFIEIYSIYVLVAIVFEFVISKVMYLFNDSLCGYYNEDVLEIINKKMKER